MMKRAAYLWVVGLVLIGVGIGLSNSLWSVLAAVGGGLVGMGYCVLSLGRDLRRMR